MRLSMVQILSANERRGDERLRSKAQRGTAGAVAHVDFQIAFFAVNFKLFIYDI